MFSALLFFYKSHEARSRWRRLLYIPSFLPSLRKETQSSDNEDNNAFEEDFSVEYGSEQVIMDLLLATAASSNSTAHISAGKGPIDVSQGGSSSSSNIYRQSEELDEAVFPSGDHRIKSVEMSTVQDTSPLHVAP
jgi:hypothetical protein